MPTLRDDKYLVTVTLTPDEYQKLRKYAYWEGVTVNRLLKQYALEQADFWKSEYNQEE